MTITVVVVGQVLELTVPLTENVPLVRDEELALSVIPLNDDALSEAVTAEQRALATALMIYWEKKGT